MDYTNFPQTFLLLQNEGALMRGCFKSALSVIRSATSGERGPLYASFFNYTIGLERLLKILLCLDRWHQDRRFPNLNDMKKYGGKSGHDLLELFGSVRDLFLVYNIEWKSCWDPDDINLDLMSFLADFANGSRYFNLNTLSGKFKGTDPVHRWERLFYKVYSKDVPNLEPSDNDIDYPLDLDTLSEPDLAAHHTMIAASAPYVCWRLVQLLIPLMELLRAIQGEIMKDDLNYGGQYAEPSIPPAMTEFLDVVCEDKSIVLESECWP